MDLSIQIFTLNQRVDFFLWGYLHRSEYPKILGENPYLYLYTDLILGKDYEVLNVYYRE